MDPVEIEARAKNLYGDLDWRRATGTLHVAAIIQSSNRIIALGPAAPSSPTDRFVLGLARARADAIVSTGAILRSEPDLVHCYSEDPNENAAIAEWRRRVLGRKEAPSLVVLSGSGKFPVDHPALSAARSGFVWTSVEGDQQLRDSALDFPVEVDSAPSGEAKEANDQAEARRSLAAALDRIRGRLRATTILVEAGPSTAVHLYAQEPGLGPRIDELLLSSFEGEVEPEAVGPSFVPEDRRSSLFGAPRSTRRIEEESGAWRFERLRGASST